jgi:hypothetical protein
VRRKIITSDITASKTAALLIRVPIPSCRRLKI